MTRRGVAIIWKMTAGETAVRQEAIRSQNDTIPSREEDRALVPEAKLARTESPLRGATYEVSIQCVTNANGQSLHKEIDGPVR